MRFIAVFLAVLLAGVMAEVFFHEKFNDGEAWKSRWVVSDHKQEEGTAGKWDVTPGKIYGDAKTEAGLTTTEDARFYAISSKLEKEFSSEGKTLVLQFSVKHDQGIDCGGGYIKVLPANVDQKTFNGDSPYNIMFGPDICGATRRVHAIFGHNGENKLVKKDVPCETDKLTHVYTLVVNGADRTYEILVDGNKRQSGKLEDGWNFLPARQIPDASVTKPADWVDEAMIADPEDVKPADWDSIPAKIADPDASKPEDWDDELDGEWEAPQIANPAYKGEWKPKKIPNPAYKGKWEQPKIDNPDFKDDPKIGQYASNGAVGFELWQVKSGSVFDNILLTDEPEFAAAEAAEIIKRQEGEKAKVAAEEKAAQDKARDDIAKDLGMDEEEIKGLDKHGKEEKKDEEKKEDNKDEL